MVARRAALAAVVLLAAGACSSTDAGPTDPRGRYIAALTTVFTRPDPALSHDIGACAATAMVDLVGAPALTSKGITAQQLADAPNLKSLAVPLPADAVDQLGDAFVACKVGPAMVRPFLRSMAKEAKVDLSKAAIACVDDHVSKDGVARGLAVTFVGGSSSTPAFDEVLSAVKECPEAASALGV